jgi:hypothetical protein
MSGDRREARRQALDQACWVDLGPDSLALGCLMKNVSGKGAKLICQASDQIPDRFYLYLTRDGKVGRKCQVVRREKGELGLRMMKGAIPKPRWLEPSAGAAAEET